MGEVTPPGGEPTTGVTSPSPITGAHDVSQFSSGKTPLDEWLKRRALNAEEARTARTFVVCAGSSNEVIGYFSLATGAVERRSAPKKLQRNTPDQLPVILLARLAVDSRCHGRGLGRDLLKEALLRSLQASSIVGARAVLVPAIDDEARRFYERYDFIAYPADTSTLFLPMDAIEKALP